MTPQERAERSAEAMYANDVSSRNLGMVIDAVSPGKATVSMTVTDTMLNGHQICHGGYIFMLADSAFAFACNSYNQSTVAQQNQITYVAPGQLGDRLTAIATEVSRTGRSGVYDVRVANQSGDTIALFRGLSRTIKGTNFPEDGAEQ